MIIDLLFKFTTSRTTGWADSSQKRVVTPLFKLLNKIIMQNIIENRLCKHEEATMQIFPQKYINNFQ